MSEEKLNFKKSYAALYDIIYFDKNYENECAILEEIFVSFQVAPISILDLGCGTGGHAIILAKKGYSVTSVDRSAEMIKLAREKSLNAGISVRYILNDITMLNLPETFDAVISMFAVMSYLTTNEELAAACYNARRHLKTGGVFIFDCWYGPSVLAQKPQPRIKEFQRDNKEKVVRFAFPILDSIRHRVEVKYLIWRIKDGQIIDEIQEVHPMRFLFPQEIRYFLQVAGFSDVHFYPFPNFTRPLSQDDWNVLVVAK